MKRRRTIVWALPALIVALVFSLAACGDSDDNAAGDKPSVSVPAGAPIKIGLICTCSGSQQANSATKQVAQAWQDWTNNNGGLNGHAVEVILKDDGGSPANGLKAARELVESDKVMAIAGHTSLVDSAWQQYVEQQQIPVVGGISFPPTMFSSPDFYPSGANVLAETYGFLNAAKEQNLTKVASFYCAEAPQCAQVSPLIQAIGGQLIGGVSLVNSASISASAPSFVSECLAAKEAGAQALAVYASPDIVERIQQQCAQQGFTPRYVGINGVLPYSAADSGNYDGAIVALGNLPIGNTATPGGKEFQEALDTYAPGLTDDKTWNANPAQAWAGLQLFAQAAKQGNLGPESTPKDVQAGLLKLKDETLGGLSGPLTFTAGKPTFQACPFIAEIKDGKWTTANDNKPVCLPPTAVAGLQKIAAASAG